jgi:hypothetical protein
MVVGTRQDRRHIRWQVEGIARAPDSSACRYLETLPAGCGVNNTQGPRSSRPRALNVHTTTNVKRSTSHKNTKQKYNKEIDKRALARGGGSTNLC